jgi:hypothetical protein
MILSTYIFCFFAEITKSRISCFFIDQTQKNVINKILITIPLAKIHNNVTTPIMYNLTAHRYRNATQAIARDLQQRIPQSSAPSLPASIASQSPHLAVMAQEHARFQRLFRRVHAQLSDLLSALDGHGAMTPALEDLAHALNTNRVPQEWIAPGAHVSLRAWVDGTAARAAYVDAWKSNAGTLPGHVLWMGALFHPPAYLAATAQIYARKYKVSVNTVFMHAQALQVLFSLSFSLFFAILFHFHFSLSVPFPSHFCC